MDDGLPHSKALRGSWKSPATRAKAYASGALALYMVLAPALVHPKQDLELACLVDVPHIIVGDGGEVATVHLGNVQDRLEMPSSRLKGSAKTGLFDPPGDPVDVNSSYLVLL